MTEVFRHPDVASALTIEDVQQGVRFVTYLPGEQVMYRGTFLEAAVYDENDPHWNTKAQLGKGVMQLCLYDLGITPDGAGEWADTVSIFDDSEEEEQ